MRVDCGAAFYGTASAQAFPYAGNIFWWQVAYRADTRSGLQSDNDDKPWPRELDSPGGLAGNWVGNLLHLLDSPQQGAEAAPGGRGRLIQREKADKPDGLPCGRPSCIALLM